MENVTQVLSKIESGDSSAAEQLLPVVYDELRKLAAHKIAEEKPGHTLQSTALVHEAYLRLVDSKQRQRWDNRRHFFAAAAEAMRRILVESARRKSRLKHGGDGVRVPLDNMEPSGGGPADELLRINDVLDRLVEEDETAGVTAKYCYFAGLTVEQAAELMGVSRATAYRHWAYAKAWLHSEIHRSD